MNDALFQRLALMGRATWQVANIGIGSTFTIKVPPNAFLVLRQIIYNHFCDTDGTEATIADILSKTIHGLSIVDQGGRDELYYTLRSPVLPSGDETGIFAVNVAAVPTIIETWKIFQQSVCVDISRVQDMKDFSQSSAKFRAEAQERPVPLGYGTGATGVNVQGEIDFPAPDSGKYFPNGDSRLIAGLNPKTAGANYRDQFRNPNNSATQLNPAPGSTSTGRQNIPPFISLGFWRVNGTPEEIAKLLL